MVCLKFSRWARMEITNQAPRSQRRPVLSVYYFYYPSIYKSLYYVVNVLIPYIISLTSDSLIKLSNKMFITNTHTIDQV